MHRRVIDDLRRFIASIRGDGPRCDKWVAVKEELEAEAEVFYLKFTGHCPTYIFIKIS